MVRIKSWRVPKKLKHWALTHPFNHVSEGSNEQNNWYLCLNPASTLFNELNIHFVGYPDRLQCVSHPIGFNRKYLTLNHNKRLTMFESIYILLARIGFVFI